MFTCEITTKFTDKLKADDEIVKHKNTVWKKIGQCWMKGSQLTSAPVLDAGVPTGETEYKLTTYWESGEDPAEVNRRQHQAKQEEAAAALAAHVEEVKAKEKAEADAAVANAERIKAESEGQ